MLVAASVGEGAAGSWPEHSTRHMWTTLQVYVIDLPNGENFDAHGQAGTSISQPCEGCAHAEQWQAWVVPITDIQLG